MSLLKEKATIVSPKKIKRGTFLMEETLLLFEV
jgi:hypothetical protein